MMTVVGRDAREPVVPEAPAPSTEVEPIMEFLVVERGGNLQFSRDGKDFPFIPAESREYADIHQMSLYRDGTLTGTSLVGEFGNMAAINVFKGLDKLLPNQGLGYNQSALGAKSCILGDRIVLERLKKVIPAVDAA